MAEHDHVPYTLFDEAVFQNITEEDFIERLTFKTLQGCRDTASTGKQTTDSTAAFCTLFEVSLHELSKLKTRVDAELVEEERRLREVQDTAKAELEGAAEAAGELLDIMKGTRSTVTGLAGELVATGRIRSVQEHIRRAETVVEVMDHFAAFCSVGASHEPGAETAFNPKAIDSILDSLRAKAKKGRDAAIMAEQQWQQSHSSQLQAAGGNAAVLEAEDPEPEDEFDDDVEVEGGVSDLLPGIYAHVTDKCFVARELVKLLVLTTGMSGSKAENHGVSNVRRYSGWLQTELVEDCFCFVDCYESFVRFLQQPSSAAKPAALHPAVDAKQLPHGRWLLTRIKDIPDAVASLGNPDALVSRYINKCFMEINAGLPLSPEEIMLQTAKSTLDSMAEKCQYESLLVHDVFHPSGFVVMHKLLGRFAEETVPMLVQTVLERAMPPIGLLDENVSIVKAAKMASARIHEVFEKDRPEAEVPKEKQRILLLNYRETYDLVLAFLNTFAELHKLCRGFVQSVAQHAAGDVEWLQQAVEAPFAPWRRRYHDWEVLYLKMYSFYHIATAQADEDVTPYASYSTLVYLTNAVEAAMEREMHLAHPLQAARNISFLALLLMQYACMYIKVCVQASISHLREALKRPLGAPAPAGSESPLDPQPLSCTLVREKPHVACLYVVAWANQSVVKLERHGRQRVEPLLRRLEAEDLGNHRLGKVGLLGDVEHEISEALKLACLLMAQAALQILVTRQDKHDFKASGKHSNDIGGCSLACRLFEAELAGSIDEINAHLDGCNRVAFAEGFAAILFEGLCAHFRSFTVNDAGALTLRADISVYVSCIERFHIDSIAELFRSLRYISDLLIVSKTFLVEYVDTNPPPAPFTLNHMLDYLKLRTDLSSADVQALAKRWDIPKASAGLH
eukprot:GGOE01015056.1.p1 GENE.GGOE01015056.1~~GGOE01015056.1.p1  ORF type:complete len:924 (-),score=327.58 GGOE01015056.1:130-2850(-)